MGTLVHLSPLGCLVCLVAPALGGESSGAGKVFPVRTTYNQSPFEYRVESVDARGEFDVLRLSYPSPVRSEVPENNTIPAEYYLPHGVKPDQPRRPAVILLHILNGNYELERMSCAMLASHGIPAILFKLPYYGERAPGGGRKAMTQNPHWFAAALGQGVEDVRRTVDVLAARPEVDPQRIGVAGISLGGILAATAAGQEPRLSRTMLVLAGGDVMQMIRQAHEAREIRSALDRLPADQRTMVLDALGAADPLRHAAGLRGRAQAGRVLMVNASDDQTIPRSCTEQLAKALGIGPRVVWLEGLGHYTAMASLPQVLQRMVAFFDEDLPAPLKTKPTEVKAGTPAQSVVRLLSQAAQMLASEPAEGRCHLAELEFKATPKEDSPVQGRLLVARGRENRFRLEVNAPMVGQAALGQSSFPWIASLKQTVFRGPDAGPVEEPLGYADPKNLTRLRVVGGALAGVALAPEMLDQVVALTREPTADGTEAICIALREKRKGSARLVLGPDKTPLRIEFEADGLHGSLTFRVWQLNAAAHDALFAPPAGWRQQQVEARALYRIYGAMFNFALESVP